MQKEVTNTITVDDFDGETPAETRVYRIGAVNYEIDLSDTNYAELVDLVAKHDETMAALEPFASRSRTLGWMPDPKEEGEITLPDVATAQRGAEQEREDEVGAQRTKPRKPRNRKAKAKSGSREPTPAEIRAWAIENNVPVSKTGRVGKATVAAYIAAHAA